MKRRNVVIAAVVVAVLGAGAFAASSMAQSYGPGWMHGQAQGYGPGWMMQGGQGYGAGWMMQGYGGGGTPPCFDTAAASADSTALNLTVDQVKTQLDRWIERQGNPRLTAGDVKEKDADTIQADVVTKDNSLVQRFDVNRHTGYWQPSAS